MWYEHLEAKFDCCLPCLEFCTIMILLYMPYCTENKLPDIYIYLHSYHIHKYIFLVAVLRSISQQCVIRSILKILLNFIMKRIAEIF